MEDFTLHFVTFTLHFVTRNTPFCNINVDNSNFFQNCDAPSIFGLTKFDFLSFLNVSFYNTYKNKETFKKQERNTKNTKNLASHKKRI